MEPPSVLSQYQKLIKYLLVLLPALIFFFLVLRPFDLCQTSSASPTSLKRHQQQSGMREIFSSFLPLYFSFCVFSDPQHQSSISPRSPKKPPPLNRYMKKLSHFYKKRIIRHLFLGESLCLSWTWARLRSAAAAGAPRPRPLQPRCQRRGRIFQVSYELLFAAKNILRSPRSQEPPVHLRRRRRRGLVRLRPRPPLRPLV